MFSYISTQKGEKASIVPSFYLPIASVDVPRIVLVTSCKDITV
jgi:hypothetical protein